MPCQKNVLNASKYDSRYKRPNKPAPPPPPNSADPGFRRLSWESQVQRDSYHFWSLGRMREETRAGAAMPAAPTTICLRSLRPRPRRLCPGSAGRRPSRVRRRGPGGSGSPLSSAPRFPSSALRRPRFPSYAVKTREKEVHCF